MGHAMNYDEKARAEALADPRSDVELIRLALESDNEETYGDLLALLQKRGTREVFTLAARLTESQSPRERALGVDILAQGQSGNKSFHDEVMGILLTLLARET